MVNPWQAMSREEAQAYDARKADRGSVAIRHAVLWELIQQYLPDDRSDPILDAGGGTGVWAIPLAQAGYSVLLTDISPGFLAQAEANIQAAGVADRIRIEQADICDLRRYAPQSFPLVLALGDPVSYCDDAGLALRELYRVTAGQGILIGDVENRYMSVRSPRRAQQWDDVKRILLDGQARWPDPQNPAIIQQFTPAELRELLRHAGWTVIALYPSDVLISLVDEQEIQKAAARADGFQEILTVEHRLREDPALLGCGLDIQFVARKEEI